MKKRRRKKAEQCPNSAVNSQPMLPPCWSQANITYFSLAENHSGIPDVPTGSCQELLLEDATEESDTDGSFAPFFKTDDTGAGVSGTEGKKFLRFVHPLTDNRKLVWETALWKNRLYIQLPNDLAEQGSRDSLVALLDAAEEHLGCTQVIIGLPRDIMDRAQLIRTFKFMGFVLLPPGHPESPGSPDFLFMAYDI
ncbi:ornithine decarboxylase antizyme 1-like [Acanthaster planci]|uniref:Ornithine decarboxylase antizyme n=1 Tax=Acanthaster planci TaxID=133434 RepID=A0A8B7Z2J3_ACAPL|nr:ornithine decarboxylase antizyme 1-like [Acanthaster planci]